MHFASSLDSQKMQKKDIHTNWILTNCNLHCELKRQNPALLATLIYMTHPQIGLQFTVCLTRTMIWIQKRSSLFTCFWKSHGCNTDHIFVGNESNQLEAFWSCSTSSGISTIYRCETFFFFDGVTLLRKERFGSEKEFSVASLTNGLFPFCSPFWFPIHVKIIPGSRTYFLFWRFL